ncbi:MAG: ABC transporter ATP-binding protein [Anaerolineae bacterium]|nr:ABC transporter ATP-binding protein [Anaerolineae bacterium]
MSHNTVFETTHLKKHFGNVKAVEDVSFEVRRGEVFGFLGPNGAGKTTTIGLALGLIHSTGGEIKILGEQVTPSRTRSLRRVGALVGAAPAIIPYLNAWENVRLVARLHPEVTGQRVKEVIDLVKLGEDAGRAAGKFSTGMKQRLGLAMALVHQPELLILDEPTNGMDPIGMREVRNLLRALADDGITVFVSSHLLHEVEQIADRVAVLNKGRIVAQGITSELSGLRTIVRVRTADPVTAAGALQTLEGVGVKPNGSCLDITGLSSEEVIARLSAHGITLSEVTVLNNNLEDLFIELTQEAA